MTYAGEPYSLPFDKGGLNHNRNRDQIPPEAMLDPSRNINLHLNGREKRGGTANVYASAITATPQILGVHDFTLESGTQHIVAVAKDGKIYRDRTNTIKTGWTTDAQFADFEVYEDELFIVNGKNIVGKWDGSAWTDLEGADLVTNGGFTTDASWNKGSDWTVDAGDNNVATFAFAAGNDLTQDVGMTTGDIYKITYTVAIPAAGEVQVYAGTTAGTARDAAGTYTEYLECAGDAYIRFRAVSGGGTLDNVSVKLQMVPSDWTGTAQPQWIVKHGRGESERMWAGGVTGKTDTVYASASRDGDDFSDANVYTITIQTGDGTGIVGAIEFGDRLILFSKTKAYIMDDDPDDTADWGYQSAQFKGGAANFRLICRTPNDVVCMMEDGDVYSIKALEKYGDYQVASLSRPAFINEWMMEYLDMSKISQFHMHYDQRLRAIKIFAVRSGASNVGLALLYFIDRGPENGWVVHDNQFYSSGYDASAAAMVRVSAGDFITYTGDYSGMLWKLEETDRNDNNNGYYAGFKTPHLTFDDTRKSKKYRRAWLTTEPKGIYDLNINWWVDNEQQTARSVSLEGAGAALDSFILDADELGGVEVVELPFDLGTVGKRIQYEIYNSVVDQAFFVSQLVTDFKYLGSKPS